MIQLTLYRPKRTMKTGMQYLSLNRYWVAVQKRQLLYFRTSKTSWLNRRRCPIQLCCRWRHPSHTTPYTVSLAAWSDWWPRFRRRRRQSRWVTQPVASASAAADHLRRPARAWTKPITRWNGSTGGSETAEMPAIAVVCSKSFMTWNWTVDWLLAWIGFFFTNTSTDIASEKKYPSTGARYIHQYAKWSGLRYAH